MDITTPKEDAAHIMSLDSEDEVMGDYVISADDLDYKSEGDSGRSQSIEESSIDSGTQSEELTTEDSDDSDRKQDTGAFGKKHFTKEEVKQKVKEAMKDKSKFKEVIAKLKNGDADSIQKIKKYTNVNQELRRNALTMANEMKVQKNLGDQLNLAQKKKIQQAQKQKKDLERAADKQKPGEIDCVFVLLNKKLHSTKADISQIEKEGKWVLHPVILGEHQFAMVVDSTILSGKNPLACVILDEVVCGPVRFILVQTDVGVVPLDIKTFKAILTEHNIKFK